MSDRIFRSMKEQMIPSDEVISGLLAQISALEASPETAGNIVAADFAAPEPAEPVKPARKSKKSIWFYSTCAVAGALVLMTSLSLFGADGEKADEFINRIVDNPAIVLNQGDASESAVSGTEHGSEEVLPGDTEDQDSESILDDEKYSDDALNDADKTDSDKPKDSSSTDSSTSHSNDSIKNSNPSPGSGSQNSPDSNAGSDSGKKSISNDSGSSSGKSDSKADSVKPDNSGKKDGGSSKTDSKQDDKKDSGKDDKSDSKSDDSSSDKPVDTQDSSKVTPGADGAKDIAWTREILSEAQIKSIEVEGSNYVVPTVIPKADTVSDVTSFNIELDETSKTNQAIVMAKVKKIRNVSSDLAVAVDVNGFSGSLIYINSDYTPGSLGQFVQDAGINAASYSDNVRVKGESLGFSSTRNIQVTNIGSLAADHLYSNTNASLSSKGNFDNGTAFCYFKSTSNPTGSTIDFSVSDNGYLYIKLSSGSSYTFHIGKEAAEAFITAVCGA